MVIIFESKISLSCTSPSLVCSSFCWDLWLFLRLLASNPHFPLDLVFWAFFSQFYSPVCHCIGRMRLVDFVQGGFIDACLLLIFKQFVMLPSSPLFLVMFRTLFSHIPDPVQNMALSFGWGLFGVVCPIVLARLIAAYSIPGFCCSVVKSPGSTIRCLNWSFGLNPASKCLLFSC